MNKVSYVYDTSLNRQLDKLEQITDRSSLLHQLVFAYGLDSQMILLKNHEACESDMLAFHSSSYVQILKDANDIDDLEKFEEGLEEFGFGYDCPLIKGIYDFVKAVVGSSVTAAHSLVQGSANIAINWYGGWHHAQRDEAKGFCYANDIVCAIHILRQKFPRVMYIDLDIHHGDGVENAFAFSQQVLTFSLHKYELGFYPGTGAITDIGSGRGRFYSVNVPLRDGIRDEPYCRIFDRVSSYLVEKFQPDVVVVQCGSDCLAGDPLGTFNITLKGIGHCVKEVLSWKKPSLFLGGGGYHIANSARCWTYLTSLIVEREIPSEIPDNPYFLRYGPCFDLEISEGNRPDCNSEEYIKSCISTITENIRKIQ